MISPKDIKINEHPNFDAFVATIKALRSPGGCPWDLKQTHKSIANNMIEEAYEAVDTIEAQDVKHLREELGDVLLQVVLQSQIAEDNGEFTIDDVCRDVNKKMIRRHPHVFGDSVAENSSEVLDIWDKVKLTEQKNSAEKPARLMDSVPKSFPALMQAQKISRKAVSAGFEWDTLDDVWNQVAEEKLELKQAFAAAEKDKKGRAVNSPEVEMEFGDLLFSLVNVGRKMGIDAETALRASSNKFRKRWEYMEDCAFAQNEELANLEFEKLQALWDAAKENE